MGPQHPSTHGVLRLVLELDGETVVSASPTIGYLHTGIEKTTEQKKWQQVIPLVERMDYLSAQSNSMAFCLSVEKLLGVEVPERVRNIRVLLAELQRINSHLVWLGTHGMEVGADLGDALLLPRARAAAQHQRDARRLPAVSELHADRRPSRRPAARLSRRRPRLPRSAAGEARRIRGSPLEEPDLPEAHPGRRHHVEGRHGGVRAGRADRQGRRRGLRRAEVLSLPRLRHLHLQRAGPDAGRRLFAVPGADRRDAREPEDLRAGARADHAAPVLSRSTIRASRRRPRIASTRRWKR